MSNIVAIIGRPNVGKSTLFNRLTGGRKAITGDQPGVTRDRKYDIAEWGTHRFTIIDTGGFSEKEDINFEKEVRTQIKIAIQEANTILFVVDCTQGILPGDQLLADILRKSHKNILLVANKADNPKETLAASTFYQLGITDHIHTISATHGIGTGDLMDAITATLTSTKEIGEEANIPRISFIGKPNVGKSTLINALLNKERSIVSPRPHTTRDATDTPYNLFGKKLIITDTAGIYKKTSTKEDIEFYSVIRSIRAIDQSDINILVSSIEEGITRQDINIIKLAHRYKKGIVILINKWDLIDKEHFNPETYRKDVITALGNMSHLPILFTSGLKKKNIYQIIEKALDVYENRSRKITTPIINNLISQITAATPPPIIKGKRLKINYAVQLPSSSPTFALFCNLPQYIQPNYKRFLEKKIRASFNFEGSTLTLVFKKK